MRKIRRCDTSITKLFAYALVSIFTFVPSPTHAESEMTVSGLKFRIETKHFEECLHFYTQHLGMKILDSWDRDDDRGAILGFSAAAKGEAFLELAYVDAPTQYEGMSLQFRVPDLAEVEERLRGAVEYRGPSERPWGSTYLYLTDPAGIPIIIYHGEL